METHGLGGRRDSERPAVQQIQRATTCPCWYVDSAPIPISQRCFAHLYCLLLLASVSSGCALTMGALLVASYHLRKGNRPQLNRALRWRIYFHGLTMVSAVGGLWYYDSNKAAPVPPAAASTPSSSSPLSPSSPEAAQSQSAAREVYQSIAKAPGRPPTNSQVSKQQHRQVSTRQEWEERFRAAQDREDAQHDQKKLEEALLKGVDLRQSLDDEVAAAEEKRRSDIQFKRDNRPVIGQDGRDRRQPSS